MSAEELAEIADLSTFYISYIENAKRKPSLESLIKISNSLEITIDELEEKGRILREYKEKFRQMCQENKMIKGSTVLKLYDKIEEVQREYEHLDNKLT